MGHKTLVRGEAWAHKTLVRGEAWAHKTSLILPLFIEVSVPGQGSEQSY